MIMTVYLLQLPVGAPTGETIFGFVLLTALFAALGALYSVAGYLHAATETGEAFDWGHATPTIVTGALAGAASFAVLGITEFDPVLVTTLAGVFIPIVDQLRNAVRDGRDIVAQFSEADDPIERRRITMQGAQAATGHLRELERSVEQLRGELRAYESTSATDTSTSASTTGTRVGAGSGQPQDRAQMPAAVPLPEPPDEGDLDLDLDPAGDSDRTVVSEPEPVTEPEPENESDHSVINDGISP